MAARHRKSSIDRLPKKVRERIGELRRAGRTIDEILDKLRELDAPGAAEVSRTALGRYTQRIDAIAKQVHSSRAVAEALVARFGEEPDDRVARTNVELMHGVVMELLASEDGEAVRLEPKDAMFLASTLRQLSQASKLDADRIMAIRQETALKAAERAVAAAKKLAKEKGVTLGKDALEQIRAEVGIVR